jgi:hypothetical protein
MESLTILIITRRHSSWKWVVENGLVVRNWGGRDEIPVEDPCTPREFLERNNEAWRQNGHSAKVVCAQVMTRFENPDGPKPYRWVVDERLDRTPGEAIRETHYFTEGTVYPRVEHRVDGRIFLYLSAYGGGREIQYCPFTGAKNTGG